MKERIIAKREKESKEDENELAKKAARKAERLDEENEINITILSGLTNSPVGEIFYNYSKDISMTGTRIEGNALLPVDTLLEIDLVLKNSKQKVTVFGKVKWSKVVEEGKTYESGVEFVNTPDASIKKLGDYILSINQYKELNPVGVPFWIFEKFNKPPS
jgi:hypothetical protein